MTPWPQDAESAIKLQQELRAKVRIEDDFGVVQTIAGVDVSYDLNTNMTKAAIVVIDAYTLKPLTTATAIQPTMFPYVPGLLSFREIPAILEAMAGLSIVPDLLMVDGQGIAHPRRLGIAAHLGVLTDKPAIGVAKSRLTGRYEEPGLQPGDATYLTDYKKNGGERIGTVLRTKVKCNPLFISPGHRVGHDSAVTLVQACLTKYRLPEPTRLADKLSKQDTALFYQAA